MNKRSTWSSDKIFSRLVNNKTSKTYWANISELRNRPNEYVFNKAFEFATSDNNQHKVIGLDILQQLGFTTRFKKQQTLKVHFELLEEKQTKNVLKSIFYGIGHNNDDLSDEHV